MTKNFLKKLMIGLLTTILLIGTVSVTVFASETELYVVEENNQEESENTDDSGQTIFFDNDSVNVISGQVFRIDVHYDKSLGVVTWKSDNSSVVSVSENGQLTARKNGTAVITASIPNGDTANCTVVVSGKEILPEKISMNYRTVRIDKSNIRSLKVTLTPDNTLDLSIRWISENPEIATVNQNGIVFAKSVGTTVIKAKAVNGLTAECIVTVTQPCIFISMNKSEISIASGKTYQLQANIQPSTTTDTFSWISSDTSVAEVTRSGLVKAKKAGSAIITAKTSNGRTATCKVVVSLTSPVAHAETAGVTSIKITWNKIPDANGYYIYRRSSSGTYEKIAAVKNGNSTSYVNNNLKAGSTCYYKVKAYGAKKDYDSAMSSAVSAKARLLTPKNLKVSSETISSVKLTWNKTPDASGYYIYRSASKNSEYKKIKTIKGNKTFTFTDTGLTTNKTYYYKIQAYYNSSYGNSPSTSETAGKSYPVLNVKRYNQYSYGLPSGCEATAAAMLLEANKVSTNPSKVVSKLSSLGLIKPVGNDPRKYFVGHPTTSGYGCYAEPMVKTLNSMLPKTKKAIGKKGVSISDLCAELRANRPVMIWATMTYTVNGSGTYPEVEMYQTIVGSSSWKLPNGKLYKWLGNEHCLLLVGYDRTYYYLNDSMTGKTVKCKKNIVDARYKEQGQYAIIVKNT